MSFFPPLTNPFSRFQPSAADRPGWGSGDYISSNSSSHTLVRQRLSLGDQTETYCSSLYDLKTLTLYPTLDLQSAGGPCQVIVNVWETHHQPRTMSPAGIKAKNEEK